MWNSRLCVRPRDIESTLERLGYIMDIRKIKKLIELLHDTDVAEIEISEGEESVRITRGSTNQVVVHSPQTNWPSTSAPPQPVVSMTAEEAAPAKTEAAAPAKTEEAAPAKT